METSIHQYQGQARRKKTKSKKSIFFVKITFTVITLFIVYQTYVSVIEVIG
ncbi:hypothetical protein ACV07N_10155 [Roseivirga echinicomitans]